MTTMNRRTVATFIHYTWIFLVAIAVLGLLGFGISLAWSPTLSWVGANWELIAIFLSTFTLVLSVTWAERYRSLESARVRLSELTKQEEELQEQLNVLRRKGQTLSFAQQCEMDDVGAQIRALKRRVS